MSHRKAASKNEAANHLMVCLHKEGFQRQTHLDSTKSTLLDSYSMYDQIPKFRGCRKTHFAGVDGSSKMLVSNSETYSESKTLFILNRKDAFKPLDREKLYDNPASTRE